MKKTQMKYLFSILGLTFLSLTLTNCSLSPQKIASQLEPSVVLLSYRNQSGHGTGFFVDGKPGVCSVLTAAHVVNKQGEIRLRTQKDRKLWDVARVEIFPNAIDLALVTFKPDTEKCNYPALKIGNSDSLRKGSSIFIYGFPSPGEEAVAEFVDGKVSGLKKLARGYGFSYKTLTVGGMSGAPVMDERGKVVAVHGMSDREVVQSLASQELGLFKSERQFSQQAEKSLKTANVEHLTFSWGVPIAFFQESKFYYPQLSELSLWLLFYGGAIFGGGIVYFWLKYFQTPQVSTQRQRELKSQLKNEERRGQEVEGRLSSLQNSQAQAQQQLERKLKDEEGRRQEVERRLSSLQNSQAQQQLERKLKDEEGRRQEVERRLSSLQNSQAQAQQQLERKLRDEQLRVQEARGRLSSLQNSQTQVQQQWERQLEWEKGKIQKVEGLLLQRQGEVKSGQIESESVTKTIQRELERQLRDEQLRGQEVEGRLNSLQNYQTQAQQRLERQLEWESGKGQEVELLPQREGQVQPLVIEARSYGDVPLVSAVGVDYTKLHDLLAAKKWKEADLETDKRMLEVAGRESQGWFRLEDVENFPCLDLGTIDKLWIKYSNGKFGFSVQKQIYLSVGGTKEYDQKVWEAFGDKVGWRQGSLWLNYSELTFTEKHCTGHLPWHLPSVAGFVGWVRWCGELGVFSSLAQRLVSSNI
jgi:V8-like Glu-specific endopeptidase